MTTYTVRQLSAEALPAGPARWAGASFLAIAALAVVANFAALAPDAPSVGAVRLGLTLFLVIVVLDLLAAWALYVAFVPVHAHLAALMAWSRVAAAVLTAAALTHLFDVTAGRATSADGVAAFTDAWQIGLLFFGVHLAALGVLALRHAGVPRWLAGMLLAAGGMYAADALARAALADYGRLASGMEVAVAVPAFAGELGFAVWLLMRRALSHPATAGGQTDLAHTYSG